MQGASRILRYHKNSISEALHDLFPNIGLDRTKFRVKCILSQLTILSNLLLAAWSNITNQKEPFEKYAHENGFDPQHVENWTSQPVEKILSIKVCSEVR